MNENAATNAEKDQRLGEVLAAYLEAEEEGAEPDRQEWLARHPDLVTELKLFFENRAQLASLPDPFKTVEWQGGHADERAGGERCPVLEPGTEFGDYRVLGEIARGGMGIVYRVRQLSLNREVALKTILAGEHASSTLVRRFRIEAEAAALLDHPHIVPIYEVGEVAGQHYFTMKLVAGGSLAARLDEFRLPERPGRGEAEQRQAAIAGLMATLARAVHHAHQRGILHRDLKPANILLQAPGAGDAGTNQDSASTPAGAGTVAMVTDFGLAKRVDGQGGVTQSQVIVGTAAYMAPEQADARRGGHGITTATDVYSLGSILYELLTGRPPFLAPSFLETVIRVIEEKPVPPRQCHPEVAADLEAICLKCLEKEPGRRYGSALELAEDLQRYGAGEAISLRPLSRVERGRRWVRRNRLAAALVAALAGLMVVATAGSVVAALRIARARDEAARLAVREREAHQAAARARDVALAALEAQRKASAENHRLLVAGYVANGTHAVDAGDPIGALVWYGEALRRDAGDPAREEAHRVRLATVLRRCPKLVQVWFAAPGGTDAIFSPDGGRVLLVEDQAARVRDVTTGDTVGAPLVHAGRIEHAAFRGDGLRVVTASADGTAQVWDARNGKPIGPALKHRAAVRFAAFDRDGRQVVTGSDDRMARVWDVTEGKPGGAGTGPRVLEHQKPVRYAAFSRDGKHLVTITGGLEAGEHELLVWDLGAGPERTPVRFPQKGVLYVRWAVFSADAAQVIWQGSNQAVHIWDYRSDPERKFGGQVGPAVLNVRAGPEGAFSPDGTRVIRASGPSARICTLATGQPVGVPLLHGGDVHFAALSPDGRLAVTAGRDWAVRVWDCASGQAMTPPLRHGQWVAEAWFNDAGSRLMTTTADGTVRVWELAPRELALPVVSLEGKGHTAISPDGALMASVAADGAVWVRDAWRGTVLHGPWTLDRPVLHLVFAPDARRLLAVSDTTARVWDTSTGRPLTPLLTPIGVGIPRQLFFTPDSEHFARLSQTNRLRIWSVAKGQSQSIHFLPGTPPWRGVSLAPGGWSVAVVKEEEVVEVRDVATGALRLGPFRHAAPVAHAAFSPDGTRLAVATADGSAYVWDVAGRPATPPLAHGQPLREVDYSGDGRRLATVAEDRTVRVWDVATGQPLTPILTQAEPIVEATLGPDGRRLVTRSETGAGRVWDLAGDDRPSDDLVRLTRVLSGLDLDLTSGGLVPAGMADLRAAWPALRAKYPHEFTPSTP